MNLLAETLDAIQRSGHTPHDVVFIGSLDAVYSCDWETFVKLADADYYDGYGSPEVATDLIVLFSDGRKMWRAEYDGSEWWDFDSPVVFDYAKPGKQIGNLIGKLWPTLEGLNSEVSSE